MRNIFLLLWLTAPIGLYAANAYTQHNLVSDIQGIADHIDPNLKNPWGIAIGPTTPFWISNNHTGTATLYDGNGNAFPAATPIVATIPAPSGGTPPAAPTGQVFNDTGAFLLSSGAPALFIFATEDGTISGWSSQVDAANAVLMIDNSSAGAVYKGLAVATSPSGPRLYAANFHAGTIDVFDSNFSPVIIAGGFLDPAIPAGFAPFNVQRIGRKLYVTYARQDDQAHDDVSGPGNGYVDVFDFDGNLISSLIAAGPLNSPWGIVIAPENFGDFGLALLVANFGDGTIHAFDPCSGQFLGTLQDPSGKVISIPGLWALRFGNGKNNADPNTLYFTAGIPGNDSLEDHGVFGSLQAGVPAPPPLAAAVTINNFAFSPTPISVSAGTQVIWTNAQGVEHDIRSDDSKFDPSPVLGLSDKFSVSLTAPGTYSYHCGIHPFMKGTIVVQ